MSIESELRRIETEISELKKRCDLIAKCLQCDKLFSEQQGTKTATFCKDDSDCKDDSKQINKLPQKFEYFWGKDPIRKEFKLFKKELQPDNSYRNKLIEIIEVVMIEDICWCCKNKMLVEPFMSVWNCIASVNLKLHNTEKVSVIKYKGFLLKEIKRVRNKQESIKNGPTVYNFLSR